VNPGLAFIECSIVDQNGETRIERFELALDHEQAVAFFIRYGTYDTYRLKLASREMSVKNE
jgi:hypothetical protein